MSINRYRDSIEKFDNFKEEPRNKYGEYRMEDAVEVVENLEKKPAKTVSEPVEKPKKSHKKAEKSEEIADAIFGEESVESVEE